MVRTANSLRKLLIRISVDGVIIPLYLRIGYTSQLVTGQVQLVSSRLVIITWISILRSYDKTIFPTKSVNRDFVDDAIITSLVMNRLFQQLNHSLQVYT